MRKVCASLFIFFLIISLVRNAFAEISESEAIAYCSKATGISSEIFSSFFASNSKLLGEVSDTLGAFDIIDKLKHADEKSAILSAANFGSMKIIAKFAPKGATVLTVFDVYCTSLGIIHSYVWIPRLEEKIYQKYKENRDGEASPREALLCVQRYINPVLADIKEKNIYPRYNTDIISSEKLRQKINNKMDNEAIAFMEAMFEERYNREKLAEEALASEEGVRKSMDETLDKLKKMVTVTIQGQIRDKESPSLAIKGARVWVKNTKIGTLSDRAGIFLLKVPYKAVGDEPFKIAVKKEGYRPALSNKSFSFKDEAFESLDCYLTPIEEEKKIEPEKTVIKPAVESQGQARLQWNDGR